MEAVVNFHWNVSIHGERALETAWCLLGCAIGDLEQFFQLTQIFPVLW